MGFGDNRRIVWLEKEKKIDKFVIALIPSIPPFCHFQLPFRRLALPVPVGVWILALFTNKTLSLSHVG
jgi:hypothetical protein